MKRALYFLFNPSWELDYLFLLNLKGAPECIVCSKVLSPRSITKFNIQRHYNQCHFAEYNQICQTNRELLIKRVKEKLNMVAEPKIVHQTGSTKSKNLRFLYYCVRTCTANPSVF